MRVANKTSWKARNMDADDRRNDRLKRCFIIAPPGLESAQIARIFSERGVECLRPDEIIPSGNVTEELLGHLANADFVVASLHGSISPNLAFELGVARALRKPALIFTTNYDRLLNDVRGVYVVNASPDAAGEAGPDIDRFLRNATESPAIEGHTSRQPADGDFTWARERAAALKHERGVSRAVEFEGLVSKIFQKAGGQVVTATPQVDRNADLIVWLNDVAFETGGAMIVECKYYGGGVGSVLKNAKHTVEHLEKFVDGSNARVGLLVFDHDRHGPPPHVFETPRVLSFAIGQLIDNIENGTFAEEVIRRRRRAASNLGTAVGSAS
jgi:hypothetical protein